MCSSVGAPFLLADERMEEKGLLVVVGFAGRPDSASSSFSSSLLLFMPLLTPSESFCVEVCVCERVRERAP